MAYIQDSESMLVESILYSPEFDTPDFYAAVVGGGGNQVRSQDKNAGDGLAVTLEGL